MWAKSYVNKADCIKLYISLKASVVWWHVPAAPATQEAEAGGSLETRSLGPA